MKLLSYEVLPYQLGQYREADRRGLAARHLTFYAYQDAPLRLITRLRRCSMAPLRQELRRRGAALDDLHALVQLLDVTLEQGDGTAEWTAALLPSQRRDLARLVLQRGEALARSTSHLPAWSEIQSILAALGNGQASRSDLLFLRAQLRPLLWRWRWMVNEQHALDTTERCAPPLTLDHYLLAWVEDHLDADVLRGMLKDTFLLPNVRVAPLPPLFRGRYREGYDYLAPTEDGQPYLAVLTAHDVRGLWHYDTLRELLMGAVQLTLAIDIQTMPRATARAKTTDASVVLYDMVYGPRAIKDKRAEDAHRDSEYALARLSTQNLHLVHVSVLIEAQTLADLDRATRAVTDKLALTGTAVERLPGAQLAYLTLFTPTPAAQVRAPLVRRNTLSENLVVKTPWGFRKRKQLRGILWGYDPHEAMPIYYDLWGADGYENGHLVMVGKSGSGKTVALLMLALRLAVDGTQTVFFDPLGKCSWLCEAAGSGGRSYQVERDAAVNILDPIERPMKQQRDYVAAKLAIVLGECIIKGEEVDYTPRSLSNFELGALDRALQDERIYGPGGSRRARIDPQNPPLLEDLVVVLREQARSPRNEPEGEAASNLAAEIESALLGSSAAIFNAPTQLRWDFDSDVVGYDFSGADKALLPLYYSHGFELLNLWVRDPRRKRRWPHVVALIDEFRYMASFRGLVSNVAMATKTWRNEGAAIWTADQNAVTYYQVDGSQNEWGAFIAENVTIKLLGKQEGSGADVLAQVYGHRLSPGDIDAIRIAGKGEFVGLFGDEVRHVVVQLTDLESTYFLQKEVRR